MADLVQGTREVLAAGAAGVMLGRIRRQHGSIPRASVAHGRRCGLDADEHVQRAGEGAFAGLTRGGESGTGLVVLLVLDDGLVAVST